MAGDKIACPTLSRLDKPARKPAAGKIACPTKKAGAARATPAN